VKRSSWIITAVLVLLALVAAWFFGLDARHAVALVGAAFAGGIANGLLESLDVRRSVLAPLPETPRGLADVQALEFSLSSVEPGARAVLEVHALAVGVLAAHPGSAASEALRTFVGRTRPSSLDHRSLGALILELEQITQDPPPLEMS
jgi:hypothetical protein